jgi:hypothetical protein
MEGTEFINYLAKIPVLLPYFKGVFSIDVMPQNLKNKCFFVSNLSPHNSPGTHWIAFLCINNCLEIFCSLGNTWDLIVPYLKFRKKITIYYNETPFQSETSTKCGKYVIYYLIERHFNINMSLHDLLEDLFVTDDINKNDAIVEDFCNNL